MSDKIQNCFQIFISAAQKKYIIGVEQREISPLYHVYYDKGLPFTGLIQVTTLLSLLLRHSNVTGELF